MRKILGITGSIASGKSFFCNILKEFGFVVIDADKIVHELYQPGNKGYNALLKNKSLKIPLNTDKTINRDKLRTIVFDNKKNREIIESIIHPLTTAEIKAAIKNQIGNIAIEIPLLFEKKLEKLVDTTICVHSPLETVIERIIKKFKINEDEAFKILNSQMPISEKLSKADIIILNNSNTEKLREKAKELCNFISL